MRLTADEISQATTQLPVNFNGHKTTSLLCQLRIVFTLRDKICLSQAVIDGLTRKFQ